MPTDLQLVQTSKEVPPFYDNVFRVSDIASKQYLIPDPYLNRAKPLVNDGGSIGPNDILGFRNRAVPVRPVIITIGDSQTYGNNALLEQNWPSALAGQLGLTDRAVYNMSTGGWSAAEYLYIADKAHALLPRMIIVAFYSGNDPLESFVRAYGNPNWSEFRFDPTLTAEDAPDVTFPAPPDQIWHAQFPDDSRMAFTPTLRRSSNFGNPAVDAGWEIMAAVADKLSVMCQGSGTELILTLIPTKETAMSERVAAAQLDPPTAYLELIADERARSKDFVGRLRALPYGRYVDVIGPLQQAAMSGAALYPSDPDGHPLAGGYAIIADTLSRAINPHKLRSANGIYAVGISPNELRQLRLITNQGWWLFDGLASVTANGWINTADGPDRQSAVSMPFSDGSEFANIPFRGVIDKEDRNRFGPEAVLAGDSGP